MSTGLTGCGEGTTTSHGPPDRSTAAAARTHAATIPTAGATIPTAGATIPTAGQEAAKKTGETAGHGLGATQAAFEAHNPVGVGEPPPGSNRFLIVSTNGEGRVIRYDVIIHANPPLSNRERMTLLAGVNLPQDAQILKESSTCIVWSSHTLKRLIAAEYAEATTESGTNSATMAAAVAPTC